jgi:hypothetical protein
MNNRIVNFQLKKVVNQDARGGLGTSVVVNPLAALHPAININYPFYPPPPRFNCELTLSNRCFSVARSVRANPLTPFPIGLTRTHPVGKTLLCLFLAGYFSARPSYPITRVQRSTLDFQTGKYPKVLNLFNFVGSDVPLSADTKFTIINSDRNDSRRDCLLQNAGVNPRTVFASTALKPRGSKDANPARHILIPARCVSTATAVGIGECACAHQHNLIFSNLTLCNRRI